MNGTMFAYAGTIMLVLGGGEMMARPSSPPVPIEVSGCHAIDGDTLRCGSVTIGYGFAASANIGQQKIDSDYRSVTEQSGIQAGDGGFDIRVQNNTDLKGALIASTERAAAEGRNRLETGTLTVSDIKNKAEYDALPKGAQYIKNGITYTKG